MPRRTPIAVRTTLVALAAAALLAGCGGSDSGSGSSSLDDAAPQAASAGDSGGADVVPGAASEQRSQAVAGVAAAAVKRVRTAQVTVEVKNLETATAAVRAVAVALGGMVGSETTGYGAAATQPAVPGASPAPGSVSPSSAVVGEAVIVLRVPEPKLDDALLRVSKVGTELTRTSSAEDVTAQLADLGSRVATQQRSLERVRALLQQASSLQEIVTIEAELSRREADLEALQARQRSLGDQAALSSLTAILRLPDAKPSSAVPEDALDDAGFLNGLKAGWKALVVSTTVVLTVVGALLPVATVLAVLGIPLWLLWRRFRPEPRPRLRPGPRQRPVSPMGPTGPLPAGASASPASSASPSGPQPPAQP